jgi:hypothetical protein
VINLHTLIGALFELLVLAGLLHELEDLVHSYLSLNWNSSSRGTHRVCEVGLGERPGFCTSVHCCSRIEMGDLTACGSLVKWES